MLPGPARMRRRSEFLAAVRTGRRSATRALTLHLSRGLPVAADGTSPHVGFVVPRAVGPAVVRNRVRRRLRHLLRDRLGQLPPGSALVVRVAPPAATLPAADLAAALDQALARLTGTRAGDERDISRVSP